jgi:two-component system nitrate/nitrite response regulator NarL
MEPFRTLFVSANPFSRRGLASLIAPGGFDIVQAVHGVSEAAGQGNGADGTGVDLILAEVGGSAAQAVAQLERLRGLHPDPRIVAMLANDSPELVQRCYAAPVDGLLSSSMSSEALIAALNLIMAGERVVVSRFIAALQARAPAPGTDRPPLDYAPAVKLSERQIEIVRGLLDGLSNKEIARRLDIEETTVKVHFKSILRKLRLRNRTEVAIWALKQPRIAAQEGGREDAGAVSGQTGAAKLQAGGSAGK